MNDLTEDIAWEMIQKISTVDWDQWDMDPWWLFGFQIGEFKCRL